MWSSCAGPRSRPAAIRARSAPGALACCSSRTARPAGAGRRARGLDPGARRRGRPAGRVEGLRRRVEATVVAVARPRRGRRAALRRPWVSLPPVEARLMAALLERYGAVVSRDALPGRAGRRAPRAATPSTCTCCGCGAAWSRCLAIRTVRSRGYLLERTASCRRRRRLVASLSPRLGGRPLRRRRDLLGAAEVALLDRGCLDRGEVVAELVHQGLAGGDVELDDVVVGDAVELLHERPQAVAVGADEHGVPGPQVGGQHLVPVGDQPGDDVGQALGLRELAGGHLGVALVAVRVVRVVGGDGRRRHVVAAAPHLHLLGAVRSRASRPCPGR